MTVTTFTLFKAALSKPRELPPDLANNQLRWQARSGGLLLNVNVKEAGEVTLDIQRQGLQMLSKTFTTMTSSPPMYRKILYSSKQVNLRFDHPQKASTHEAFSMIFDNAQNAQAFVHLMSGYFEVVGASAPQRSVSSKDGRKKNGPVSAPSRMKSTASKQISAEPAAISPSGNNDLHSTSTASRTRSTQPNPPNTESQTLSHDTEQAGIQNCSVIEPSCNTLQSPVDDKTTSPSRLYAPLTKRNITITDTQSDSLTIGSDNKLPDDPLARLKQGLLKDFVPTTQTKATLSIAQNPSATHTPNQPLFESSPNTQNTPVAELEPTQRTEDTDLFKPPSKALDDLSARAGQPISQTDLLQESLIIFSPDIPSTVPEPPSIAIRPTIKPASSESYVSAHDLGLDELYPPMMTEQESRRKKRKREEDDLDSEDGLDDGAYTWRGSEVLTTLFPSTVPQAAFQSDGQAPLSTQGHGVSPLDKQDLKTVLTKTFLEHGYTKLCTTLKEIFTEFTPQAIPNSLGVRVQESPRWFPAQFLPANLGLITEYAPHWTYPAPHAGGYQTYTSYPQQYPKWQMLLEPDNHTPYSSGGYRYQAHYISEVPPQHSSHLPQLSHWTAFHSGEYEYSAAASTIAEPNYPYSPAQEFHERIARPADRPSGHEAQEQKSPVVLDALLTGQAEHLEVLEDDEELERELGEV